jgi:rhamnosyltransferase subunit B
MVISRRQVLIVVIGSSGDVFAMIELGRALVARGHRVRLLSSPNFAAQIRAADLAFHPCVSRDEEWPAIHDPGLWKAGRGYRVLFDALLKAVPETYRAIEAHYIPGRTMIVANAGAMAARIARETLDAPLATVHLQPIMLRSRNHQPGLMMSKRWTPLIRAVRSVLMPVVDRNVFDALLAPGLNQFRATLGLPPVSRLFAKWIHSPDLVLGMFPEWFAQPEHDWPAHTYLTGFPKVDQERYERLPPQHSELDAFLDAGPPPIAFAFATTMPLARRFVDASIEACHRLGNHRGVLFTHSSEALPPLSDNMRHFRYDPSSRLLPRMAGLVHHGSIDVTAAAFAAGIPQIVVPLNFDQPDNGARLSALRAGAVIRSGAYTAEKLARTLTEVLGSKLVLAKCRSLAAQIRGTDSMGIACDLLEAAGDLALENRLSVGVS